MATRRTAATETETEDTGSADEGLSDAQKRDVAAIVADALKGTQPAKVKAPPKEGPAPDETVLSLRQIEEQMKRTVEDAVQGLKSEEREAAHDAEHQHLRQEIEEEKKANPKVLGAAGRFIFGDG